ncbi:hypothetical protein V8G54_020587 [Vigna mungo]|uniref:Reverse transcriptase/retrotransposon-derived protein RNase H-like domain-containing protein n=1 Tax=Vigna mungo TaxID=3915 RepID=A0AAQ3NCS9_VIGMU
MHTPEQQAWLHKLLRYDFAVKYKPGTKNLVADALSISCFKAFFLSLNGISSQTCTMQLVLPAQHPLLKTILQEFHSYPIGGHSGIARTLAWAKSSTTSPTQLLQPLPIPHQWEDLAMDFIVGLPSSYGFFVIMVVIDRLSNSKWKTSCLGNSNRIGNIKSLFAKTRSLAFVPLFKGGNQQPYLPLPFFIDEHGLVIQPLKYWSNAEGLDISKASLEDVHTLQIEHPNFNLEDKVDLHGKRNVTNDVGSEQVGDVDPKDTCQRGGKQEPQK